MLEVSQAIKGNGLADVAGKIMVQTFLEPNTYTRSQLVEQALQRQHDVETADVERAVDVLEERRWLQATHPPDASAPPRYSVSDLFLKLATAVRMEVTTMPLKEVQQPYNNAVDDLREIWTNPQHLPAHLRYLGAIAFLGENYSLEHIHGDSSGQWLPGKSGWEVLTAIDATGKSS